MSLPHILLGLLRDPATGYDLRQTFASGAAHYWGAHLSQIYPALKKLETAGHVSSMAVESSKGPQRLMYHRTQSGLDELCAWTRSGAVTGTSRVPYLAQLEFAYETGETETTLQLINDLRTQFEPLRDLLTEGYKELAEVDRNEGLDDRQFSEFLVLRLGVLTLNARMSWCDEAEQLARARR